MANSGDAARAQDVAAGSEAGGKGGDGQTLTFPILGSAAQEPGSRTSRDYIPYLQLKHHKLGITEKAP